MGLINTNLHTPKVLSDYEMIPMLGKQIENNNVPCK
jgi:hypothetical protein